MPKKKSQKKPKAVDEKEVAQASDELRDKVSSLNELPTEVLDQLLKNLEAIEEYNRKHPEGKTGSHSYAALRSELLQMGLTPETTYLYIQGHTLFENVVLPLLSPICTMLRKEREREIRQLACHSTQRQNELSSYQHSQMPIEQVLKRNTNFKKAPPFAKLCASVEQMLRSAQAVSTVNPAQAASTPEPVAVKTLP